MFRGLRDILLYPLQGAFLSKLTRMRMEEICLVSVHTNLASCATIRTTRRFCPGQIWSRALSSKPEIESGQRSSGEQVKESSRPYTGGQLQSRQRLRFGRRRDLRPHDTFKDMMLRHEESRNS